MDQPSIVIKLRRYIYIYIRMSIVFRVRRNFQYHSHWGFPVLAPDGHDFQCKLLVSVANFIPRHIVLFEFKGLDFGTFSQQKTKVWALSFIPWLKFVFKKRPSRPFCYIELPFFTDFVKYHTIYFDIPFLPNRYEFTNIHQ